MGVFDDKKFDGLDWISQATEPIDSKMNEVLALMPDNIDIDFNMYRSFLGSRNYGTDLSISYVVGYYIAKANIELSYQQQEALVKCFKFEMEGDDVLLDFENKVISGGKLSLVKTTTTMDEQLLKNMLGAEGIEQLSYCNTRDFSCMSRMNEVMELLTKCEQGLKTRSVHKKRSVMVNRLKTLFKDNEWNIRDTELANKVGTWIRDYIQDGNLAAFSNFCRLKVMTHKGQPIYSMEEVQ